jgi:hypothetical protein
MTQTEQPDITTSAAANVESMTLDEAVRYINAYPTEASEWVQHRTMPNIQIETTYPHRLRYLKHYRDESTRWHIRRLCKVGGIIVPGRSDDTDTTQRLHIIIAQHFVPNPENKQFVEFVNGCRHDCHIENLVWKTMEERATHRAIPTRFKGQRTQWLDVLPADYQPLTELNGHQLLADTFYRIGDEFAQKYSTNDEVRYRIIPILTRRRGTATTRHRYFRNADNVQIQIAA